jgi:stress response protein YsnF
VVVERRPVNREVDGPVSVRQTRKAIIVPILQEVLVVQKKLMLREELVITKRRTVRPARQVVTLRHDEVEIERVGTADGTAGREREPDRAPAPRPGAVEGGGTDPAADRGGRGRRGAGKSKR